MDLPVRLWYDAIYQRHSRRSYLPDAPVPSALAKLERVCAEFRPFAGARSVVIQASPEEVFKGVIGHYGKVQGAPMYAAFVGDMTVPSVQEAVGYTGEALVLEATAAGLSTCWVGGAFRPRAVAEHVRLAPGERVLAVTPLGYAQPARSRDERVMEEFIQERKRKTIRELLDGGVQRLPAWAAQAVASARLAPSAANRQPWLFAVDEAGITVATSSWLNSYNISKRLDCGIAMLHLELGARMGGRRGAWELRSVPEVARFGLTDLPLGVLPPAELRPRFTYRALF